MPSAKTVSSSGWPGSTTWRGTIRRKSPLSSGCRDFKITRLLAQAREKGIVKISLDQNSTETLAIGQRLTEAFGLIECVVTPPLGGNGAAHDETARRAVGIAAASFLARRLQGPEAVTVGFSWGRTIAALVQAFPAMTKPNARFVSADGFAQPHRPLEPL